MKVLQKLLMCTKFDIYNFINSNNHNLSFRPLPIHDFPPEA
jgi:hypothetical protein